MLNAHATAPDLILLGLDGESHRLSEAWQTKPAILVFLRHFGCVFCKQQVVDLRSKQTQLDALGVNVVLVSQGDPVAAQAFVAKYRIPFFTYCDPERTAYAAYGIGRTENSHLLKPSLYLAAAGAMARGNFQGRTEGERTQMPGLFVVGTDGLIAYSHQYAHAGDAPSMNWLLRLLPELIAKMPD